MNPQNSEQNKDDKPKTHEQQKDNVHDSPNSEQGSQEEEPQGQLQEGQKKEEDDEEDEECEEDESDHAPVMINISTFTRYFKGHLPILFVCYTKLIDDLQYRYDKLYQKIKFFLMRQKRPYRMFITVQNMQIDFQALVQKLEPMDLSLGSFLIFQSNFNDLGGITIENYSKCFILRANMKKDSQFQNGYCRFGALQVYQILFCPSILEKQENIVFDDNKELIRAAKWKGYRTFYLSEETLLDGLVQWTNIFSMQNLVFRSQDLTPLTNKICRELQKIENKNMQSKWKVKDTMGRSWIATAEIVGYMIEMDEINFSSQLVKIINNMYRAMLLRTFNIELVMLQPSINFKFPKDVTERVLLHYIIQDSQQYIQLCKTQNKFQDVLRSGTVTIDNVQYELDGLGGILIVASLFFVNPEIHKIFNSIYLKINPQISNTMWVYIRDLRIVFNVLKEINVKSQYFFDIEGKRKFSVMDIAGVYFIDMNRKIKREVVQKLDFLRNYLQLKEHQKIFEFVTDKQLKYFQINKKTVYHNLVKRINNLVECYQGLQNPPDVDILHRIDMLFSPSMSFENLKEKIKEEGKIIITSDFPSDINLLLYYLDRQLSKVFKNTKIIDVLGMSLQKLKKKISECKKSSDQIIFIRNYDALIFEEQCPYLYNFLIGPKGQRSVLVVGCNKKGLPLKENQSLGDKNVNFPIVEIKGVKVTEQLQQFKFSEQKYQILEQLFERFVPKHKQTFISLLSVPQFKSFIQVPSMLHHFIQLSPIISKKKIMNLNALFKVFRQSWSEYINEQHGRTIYTKVKTQFELLTAQYFTYTKSPELGEDGGMYRQIFKIFQKQYKKKSKKRVWMFETLSFLTYDFKTITFKHQMYAACFATQFIIQEVDNFNSSFQYVKHFVSNSMIRAFVIEKLYLLNMQQKLMDMIKESKYRAQVQSNLTNCGIALTLLGLIRPDFSGQNFAFCEFPHATFEGCNLTNTDFSYANLLNCYFGRANCYETSIFRCKHIGSVQFEQVDEHQSNKQVKQVLLYKNKTAYMLVDDLLQIWQYPFSKMLTNFHDRKQFKKICIVGEYLFGYTFQNQVQIWDLQDNSIKIQLRSHLLIIHDMIVTQNIVILTSNTSRMQQWMYQSYLKFAQNNDEETYYNPKLIGKYSRIFYGMKRVCSIAKGQKNYFYIGDCEGTIFKYNINSVSIICDHKITKEAEVTCIGFFQGERQNKLITFTEDLILKLYHVKYTRFQQVWSLKQFEMMKQVSVNEQMFYTMSGHAVYVYGKKSTGAPISKLNYHRQDGLNFVSMVEDTSNNKILVSHMKGVLTLPFISKDIYRDTFGHEYSITSIIWTKMPIVTDDDKNVDIDVIISGSLDMKINFWGMQKLDILASIDTDCTISQLVVFNKLLLAASHNFCILIYCLDTFQLLQKLANHEGSVNCMCINDEIFYTGANDKRIIKWYTQNWQYKQKYEFPQVPTFIICGLEYFEAIVGTEQGKILWLDYGGFVKHQKQFHKTPVECIILQGEEGYSCSSDSVFKWGVNNRQAIEHLIIPSTTFTTISFFKQEYILATIDHSIMFLSKDLKQLVSYPVHQSKIKCIIYNQKSQKIYTAGDDRCIKKFCIQKGYDHLKFEMSMPKRLALNKVQFS